MLKHKSQIQRHGYYLVSFIFKNMGDTHHSVPEIVQAGFNNSHYVKK